MSRTATEAERYRREAEDRVNRIANNDKKFVDEFDKRTSGFAPVQTPEERGPIETESSKEAVRRSEIGYTQRDRMLNKQAKERAAQRAKDRAAEEARPKESSAQQIADRFDIFDEES